MENKKIELDLEQYEKILTENISLKKDMEYMKQQKESVVLEVNTHTNPVPQEEKKIKKGLF